MSPALQLVLKPDLRRDDCSTSQLSPEKYQFFSELTSLYMISTPYNSQPNLNLYNGQFISYTSQQLAPYEYCTANFQINFTLQMTFLRPTPIDLHTDDSNPNLQHVIKKRVHRETYKSFCDKNILNFLKTSYFSKENSHHHFHFICFISRNLIIQMARCEIMILWNNTIF